MDQLSGSHSQIVIAVADPGFSRDGCANSPGGGGAHMILPNFPKKCMKLKELDPPLYWINRIFYECISIVVTCILFEKKQQITEL